MASSMPLERMESRKSHSWWWESHINPRNAKWITSSLEEMERNTEHMVKLIEDDGDSFAKKAEMYYKRRPELITQVHDFQRMYRTLAERYEQLTVDLHRNVADLQLHAPVAPDLDSEPITPRFLTDVKLNRYRSSHRAAGFEVFLGSFTDRSPREVSPAPGSEESDVSSVHNYPRMPVSRSEEALDEKTIPMDAELSNDKENASLIELQLKVAGYEVEIGDLKMELENVRSLNLTNLQGELSSNNKSKIDEEEDDVKQIQVVQEDTSSTDLEVSDPEKVRALFEELKLTKGKLNNLEMQNERLSNENKLAHEIIRQLKDQLKEAQKEDAVLRSKLDLEMRKAHKREEKIARLKGSLKDREVEIRELKETIADASKKYQLHDEISRLTNENDRVGEKFRELEVHCHTLETQNAGVEKKLSDEIEQLKVEVTEKSDQLEALKLKYDIVMSERDELVAEAGLSNELKIQVERQRVLLLEAEEEKREAIRQLCFSLEHYRKGYEQLREASTEHKGLPVLLAS